MTISKLVTFLALLFLLPLSAQAQVYGGSAMRYGSVGSWTPGVTAAGTAGTPAYTTQVGSYVKMGSFVHVQFNLVLSGWTGSPSGNVSVTGLPFTATTTANDNGGCVLTNYTVTGLTASNWSITGIISPSTTSATLFAADVTGNTNVTAAQTGTTPTLVGFCNYHL